jgi:hypothetical protein
MAQQAPSRTKIPTTGPRRRKTCRLRQPGRIPRGSILASGNTRAAARSGAPVIELEHGITVYLPRGEQGRWRAVWHENGQQQCEATSEDKLAARLAKVTERLQADAPNITLRGADLIAYYLSADRLPVHRQWSRKHAHTQLRLCERFAAPVSFSRRRTSCRPPAPRRFQVGEGCPLGLRVSLLEWQTQK